MSFARSDADARDDENAYKFESVRRRNGEKISDVHATQRAGQQENEEGTSFRWEERMKYRT